MDNNITFIKRVIINLLRDNISVRSEKYLYPQSQKGCACLQKCSYHMGEMTIFFTRWFVENYEQAKYMKLDGWNLHKKLLTPYRVEVLSNKLGSCSMVGNNAKEIANAADALDAVLDVNNSLIGQSRQR